MSCVCHFCVPVLLSSLHSSFPSQYISSYPCHFCVPFLLSSLHSSFPSQYISSNPLYPTAFLPTPFSLSLHFSPHLLFPNLPVLLILVSPFTSLPSFLSLLSYLRTSFHFTFPSPLFPSLYLFSFPPFLPPCSFSFPGFLYSPPLFPTPLQYFPCLFSFLHLLFSSPSLLHQRHPIYIPSLPFFLLLLLTFFPALLFFLQTFTSSFFLSLPYHQYSRLSLLPFPSSSSLSPPPPNILFLLFSSSFIL